MSEIHNTVSSLYKTIDNETFETTIEEYEHDTVVAENFHSNISGTNLAPAFSFIGDLDNGMYLKGTDNLAFAAGGVNSLDITNSSINFNQAILAPAGSESLPSHSFVADSDTGFYNKSAGIVSFSSDGDESLVLDPNGLCFPGGKYIEFIDDGNWTMGLNLDTYTSEVLSGANCIHMRIANTVNEGVQIGNIASQPLFEVSGSQSGFVTSHIPMHVPNGSLANPGYAFKDETNTGIYLKSANQIGFVINGVDVFDVNASGASTTADAHLFADGTISNPAIAFTSAPSIGFYKGFGNNLSLAMLSGNVIEFTPGQVFNYVKLTGINGTEASPGFSFNISSNAGMYQADVNNLGFSVQAVNRLNLSTTDATFSVPLDITDTTVSTSTTTGCLNLSGGMSIQEDSYTDANVHYKSSATVHTKLFRKNFNAPGTSLVFDFDDLDGGLGMGFPHGADGAATYLISLNHEDGDYDASPQTCASYIYSLSNYAGGKSCGPTSLQAINIASVVENTTNKTLTFNFSSSVGFVVVVSVMLMG